MEKAKGNFVLGQIMYKFQEPFCRPEITSGVHKELICIIVLDMLVSVSSFLANGLVLFALRKECSIYPPTKLLFYSLSTTDLLTGMVTLPIIITQLISILEDRLALCHYTVLLSYLVSFILSSVSLFTLTAISADRLLAIYLGLRYRSVVNMKRAYGLVIVIWLLAIVATLMYFWDPKITSWYGSIGIFVCLSSSSVAYTKIFLKLRRHQTQVLSAIPQQRQTQAAHMNVTRFKRAVNSALWLQLSLIACYLPFGIADGVMTHGKRSSLTYITREFALTLVFFNSSLNPILYCWKMQEVRGAVKDTLRRIFHLCIPGNKATEHLATEHLALENNPPILTSVL